MRTIGSPSEIVKSPTSIKALLEAPNGPRYGRPSGRTGPPTALFSPALALLGHDLEHLDDVEPDAADIAFAFSLIENATGFTDDAGEREAVLRSILGRFLEDNSKGSGGTWLEGTFAYPIIEIKHEQGRGGDPFLQGLVVYSKTIAQEEVLFSPCSFHSAVIPRTVSKIPRPVKPTSCPTRHRRDPAYRLHRYLHRLHLR